MLQHVGVIEGNPAATACLAETDIAARLGLTWLPSIEARRVPVSILARILFCRVTFLALAAPMACLKTSARLSPRDA